jgi:hypothetical protein
MLWSNQAKGRRRRVNRIEIEVKLNKDRAWLLSAYAELPAERLRAAATKSEHDDNVSWSALDHLAHLAGIERTFNAMIERHLGGDANPVGLVRNADGSQRALPEIMKTVHRMNEEWVEARRGCTLVEMAALGQQVRAETLALLGRLSDEQLQQKLPGAPWADGTIGGVIGVNALHGRQHWQWVIEGLGTGAKLA